MLTQRQNERGEGVEDGARKGGVRRALTRVGCDGR